MSDESKEETVHESTTTRSHSGVASFFRRIARRLRRGDPVPVDEEQTLTVQPAAESEFEVELEQEGDELSLEFEMAWEGDTADIDTDAEASKARFEVYEDSAKQWRWRLVHDNGNIIADGGQGYASKQKVTQGLESVKQNVADAPVVDTSRDEESVIEEASDATVELFSDNQDQWRWRLVHDNGSIIADGGQGYSSKQKAKQGLRSVKTNAPGARVESDG